MKKLLYFLFVSFCLCLQAQTSGAIFRTGVNFPFYTPGLVSIDRYLQLIAQSGAKSIRQMTYADVHWKQIEPINNAWNFSYSDSAFNNSYTLTPIGTLYSMMGNDTVGFQTPWLACNLPLSCYWDPAGDSIFSKDYISTVINRYRNVTKYWEIGNEIENTVPPQGLQNIAKQKEFLQLNYKWIKNADPQAKVILPGLLGTYSYPVSNSYTWLRNMLGAGAGNSFDIMNYHDYNSWWTLPAHYDSIKTILQNYGLNKPVWVTETSISSMNVSPITPPYSSNDGQAADVWRRMCLLWAKGAEVVFWHTGWSNGDLSGWGEFGILDVFGKKKKSFHSFKLLNQKIADFSSVTILSTGNVTNNNTSGGNGIWAIEFVVDGSKKWVLWSPDNQTYTLNGITANNIKITQVVPHTLLGGGDSAVFNSSTHTVTGGSFTFNTLTEFPVLAEEQNSISIEDNIIQDLNLSLYPNPAQNMLTVSYNADITGIINFDIYSADGKKQLSTVSQIYNKGTQIHEIDIQTLQNGFYILNMQAGNKTVRQKFLITR